MSAKIPHLSPKIAEIVQLLSAQSPDSARVMHLVKTANAAMVDSFLQQALKGLAIGGGIAVPSALAGKYLLDQAGQQAKERNEETWDRITRAALGAAGVGAGIYALNRMSQGPAPAMEDEKQASAEHEVIDELMTKVAAAVMVDEMLSKTMSEELSQDCRKLAEEIRQLNNGYLVELLREVA